MTVRVRRLDLGTPENCTDDSKYSPPFCKND